MSDVMSQSHSFSVRAACEVGVNAAIIVQGIYFWCQHNEANEKNIHDGRAWTYNSVAAFHKLYPYMSEKTIQRTLRKLVDDGYLITGNFNQTPYDRTKWYALTEKGESLVEGKSSPSICSFDQIENLEQENGKPNMGEPIPVVYTDVSPDTVRRATRKRGTRKPRKREDLVTLGEFGHVSMTKRQYETLGEKLGESLRDEYVSRVDAYCERKSTTYANPYQTVLNWYRDDVRNNRVPVVAKVCEFSCDDGYALLSVEDASHVAETVMDSILDEARGHMRDSDFEDYRARVLDEHDRYMREMF